jgi:hypothetical protein
MGTHDAHEILSAFRSIDKLRTLGDKLDVVHASLILDDDEEIRLIRRLAPTRKSKRPVGHTYRKNHPVVEANPSVADHVDSRIPFQVHVIDHQLSAVYNSLPFDGSKKVKHKPPSLRPLITHDRNSVSRFRKYSRLDSSTSRV